MIGTLASCCGRSPSDILSCCHDRARRTGHWVVHESFARSLDAADATGRIVVIVVIIHFLFLCCGSSADFFLGMLVSSSAVNTFRYSVTHDASPYPLIAECVVPVDTLSPQWFADRFSREIKAVIPERCVPIMLPA